jgi:hypothetical protein
VRIVPGSINVRDKIDGERRLASEVERCLVQSEELLHLNYLLPGAEPSYPRQ